ncbi:MAG: 2-phosphosulfolactate phosphatase, partial [Planctomycetota bacterium]
GGKTQTLLCGERGGLPIDGFDLGNSPRLYTPRRVAGRDLIITTTNGTVAIATVANAQAIYAASFWNLQSTINRLRQQPNVLLLCAGTNGEVTAEDVLLAGAITSGLQKDRKFHQNDAAIIAAAFWQSESEVPLAQRLRKTQGGINLSTLGLVADVDDCAAIDVHNDVVQLA